MKRFFTLGSAAVLSLTLLTAAPSFGKGGGHGHGGGQSHGGGGHSGGHAHSSGHAGRQHHSSGHSAPSHSAHPQMTQKAPKHPQTHPHPTHPQPAPTQTTPNHVAKLGSTSNQTFTHNGGSWHHGHHWGWDSWGGAVGVPGYYGPYWNDTPGVVVVPEETEIIEQEYVTRVTPPATRLVSSQNQPVPSQNADGTDPAQVNTAP
jgi:hypothetical protein